MSVPRALSPATIVRTAYDAGVRVTGKGVLGAYEQAFWLVTDPQCDTRYRIVEITSTGIVCNCGTGDLCTHMGAVIAELADLRCSVGLEAQ